jgi:hypothetical protein
MSPLQSKLVLACSALCCAAFATPAAAWDWLVKDTGEISADLHSASLSADAGGYWLAGEALVRFDEAGNRLFSTTVTFANLGYALTPDGSGGAIAASQAIIPPGYEPPPLGCSLGHVDASGLLRWHTQLDLNHACDQVQRDGEGYLWVTLGTWNYAGQDVDSDTSLRLLDARGVSVGSADLPSRGLSMRELLADPNYASAYVYDGDSVTALDTHLGPRWFRNVDGQAQGRIAVTPNSALWLAEANVSSGQLHIARYDVNGAAQVDVRVAALSLNAVLALSAAPDGGVYELDRTAGAVSTSPLTLRHFDAAGALQWSSPLGSDVDACAAYYGRCALAVTSKGNVVLALHQPAAGDDIAHIALRAYGADGQRRGSVAAPARLLAGVAVLADGSSLALLRTDTSNLLVEPAPNLLHLDADGKAAASVAGRLAKPAPFINSVVAADGDMYLLTQTQYLGQSVDVAVPDQAGHYTLTHLGADGTLRWRVQGEGLWFNATVVADGSRVCLGGLYGASVQAATSLRVACYARTDGTLAWARTSPSNGQRQGEIDMALTPDHGISALAKAGAYDTPGLRHQAYASDGTLLHDTLLANAPHDGYYSSFNAAGDVAVMDTLRLASVRADGSLRYAIDVPTYADVGVSVTLQPAGLDLRDDGSVIVFGQVIGQNVAGARLWSLAPNGTQRWLRTLTTSTAYGTALLPAGSDYLDLSYYEFSGPEPAFVVVRANRSDGSLRWQHAMSELDGDRLIPSVDAQHRLVGFTQNASVGLRLLDGEDGSELALRHEACTSLCQLFNAGLGSDGVLRGVWLDESVQGPGVLSAGLAQASQVPPRIRLDQHALGGAWWAPYSDGQGFMLDVLPASKTFFMPWFTFTPDGINDPKDQRWYTIQGTIPAGATELSLGIYDSRGGVFDAAQPTTPSRVGTATLHFANCDHGSLHYHFDAPSNAASEGDISLSRLLPNSETCQLADGSSTLPSATSPPRAGFDARMSGSWFEPANAGQGLQLWVQPDGPLFAAWFTYDPAGLADDATAQHWLTLQGDLAGAHDGVAEVVIAEAIGGQLDGAPTRNQYRLGSAVLKPLACDHLRVDYSFDDASAAGAYRKKAGTLDLVKIGGCSP